MNQDLIQKLELIGIVEASQLEDKDLDEWRIIKFKEIQKQYSGDNKKIEEEKIKINCAYQDLQEYPVNELINFLNKKNLTTEHNNNKIIFRTLFTS